MDPTTTGAVRVAVTVDGTPRSGVTVGLFSSGGSSPDVSRATGSTGAAIFDGLEAGAVEVEVTPPSDADLAAGESARKSTTVVVGQTAEVAFSLESNGVVPMEVLVQDNLTFSPAELTIQAGTTVRWRSTSAMVHTVTPDGHSIWSAASLSGVGQTFEHTFTTPGTYDYYCEPHLSSNMRGRIIVQ